jgi:hypothetical protein
MNPGKCPLLLPPTPRWEPGVKLPSKAHLALLGEGNECVEGTPRGKIFIRWRIGDFTLVCHQPVNQVVGGGGGARTTFQRSC